jgi:hypothetical protein
METPETFSTSTLTTDQLLQRKIKLHKYQIIADIVLVVVIIFIGLYIFNNIESLKVLNNDVCKLCMSKTGATCTRQNNNIPMGFNLPNNINISNLK